MKYFIFYFLIISTSVWPQKPANLTQQEYLALQEKVTTSTSKNIDSAFVYAKQIEASDNNAHKAFATAAMSYLFQLKGDSEQSKLLYQQANLLLGRVPPSREKKILQTNILNYGGLIDWYRLDLKNALDKFQAGLSIAKETGNPIQALKFNVNIASILTDAGNFNSAIFSLQESDKIANQNKNLLSNGKFDYYKSIVNYNLGMCYEKAFSENKSLIKLLDSAKVYYTKAILFSKEYPITKVNCKIGLGNIAYIKKDFVTAQKAYYDVLLFSKENDLKPEYFIANYNLGDLFFNRSEWDKSLVFFQKVDSIYKINKINDWYYINANYYMAKIYSEKNNPKEALRCSNIYLDNLEKVQLELDNQVSEVNFSIGKGNLKKEMEEVQYQNRKKVWLNYALISFFVLLFVVLIVLYATSLKRKKQADKKVIALIEEFKLGINKIAEIPAHEQHEPEEIDVEEEEVVGEKAAKSTFKLSLDSEKEQEIFEKLKALEEKLFFLNADFTLQWVSKKIKTNTSYLSYVVNKRFGKSFSEYSNELKINYVINELITNAKYRKYSTQALAESVGFKNAVSFTKSFSKRTGVTPTQFTKRL